MMDAYYLKLVRSALVTSSKSLEDAKNYAIQADTSTVLIDKLIRQTRRAIDTYGVLLKQATEDEHEAQ